MSEMSLDCLELLLDRFLFLIFLAYFFDFLSFFFFGFGDFDFDEDLSEACFSICCFYSFFEALELSFRLDFLLFSTLSLLFS